VKCFITDYCEGRGRLRVDARADERAAKVVQYRTIRYSAVTQKYEYETLLGLIRLPYDTADSNPKKEGMPGAVYQLYSGHMTGATISVVCDHPVRLVIGVWYDVLRVDRGGPSARRSRGTCIDSSATVWVCLCRTKTASTFWMVCVANRSDVSSSDDAAYHTGHQASVRGDIFAA